MIKANIRHAFVRKKARAKIPSKTYDPLQAYFHPLLLPSRENDESKTKAPLSKRVVVAVAMASVTSSDTLLLTPKTVVLGIEVVMDMAGVSRAEASFKSW